MAKLHIIDIGPICDPKLRTHNTIDYADAARAYHLDNDFIKTTDRLCMKCRDYFISSMENPNSRTKERVTWKKK